MKYLVILTFLALASVCSSLRCGAYNYCDDDYYNVYCCGVYGDLCCYQSIYQIWWFWFIWLMLFIMILACSFGVRRRRRLLLLRRQQAIITTPTVVTIGSSGYNPSGTYLQTNPQYPYPVQQNYQPAHPQQQPQYPYYGTTNQNMSSPPPYSSIIKPN